MLPKSSLLIYLIVSSLVFLVIIWLFNFFIFSKFAKVLSEEIPFEEIQLEVKGIKDKIFVLAISVSIFIFFFNFFVLKIERNLSEEEKKIETILKANPNEQFAQKKLKQIRKKRIIYSFLIERIFQIVLGIVICLFTFYLVQPLYKFLGIIK